MTQTKKYNTLDIFMFVLYILTFPVILAFLYYSISGFLSDEVVFRVRWLVSILATLLLYVFGLISLGRRGILPHLFDKCPKTMGLDLLPYSPIYYARYVAIICLPFSISILMSNGGWLFELDNWARAGVNLWRVLIVGVIIDNARTLWMHG
ncbi:MAG: hypothetical protein FWE11_08875 [Defluviitaleaceae bacterium]|nr:hypothetical protein [Defluviitaleaceae bacterium]